jgi:outer membrane protein assembly factor BamB
MNRIAKTALTVLCGMAVSTCQADAVSDVMEISGVQGGLVVHLGCGDGHLTAALRKNAAFTVHGLEADPVKVAAAREYISSLGRYGQVSVEHFDGQSLPYADNLINLMVVEDQGRLTDDELLRVLVPNGVLCTKANGNWSVRRKPRPDNIGEWTHFLQDAGNNPVARDTVVGPPRRLQWTAPPLWLRSHETPSGFQGLVTGGGRLFYLLDEGPIGIVDPRLPEKWSLVARDAFNGKLLWKRRLDEWGWPFWETDPQARLNPLESVGVRGQVPDANFRRMVIEKDRLVVTLGFSAPVSILDAATGETLATAAGTERTDWVMISDGVALALRKSDPKSGDRVLAAVDVESGGVLWEKVIEKLSIESLAAKRRRVFYVASGTLECLDISTGQPRWSTPHGASHLVAYEDLLVAVDGKTFTVLTAADGTQVCQGQGKGVGAMYISRDVIWYGPSTWKTAGRDGKSPDVMALGFSIRTGEQTKEVYARNLFAVPHHARCYRNKATERYIISGKEGAEFLDLWEGAHSQNNWVRGACRQGIVPANGFLYAPPDQCFCDPGAKVLGLCAIGPAASKDPAPVPDSSRLLRGQAYASTEDGPTASPDDWPTYRHDAARWGSTDSPVRVEVHEAWRTNLGGRLTPPVAADGRVFVAAVDRHQLYALDAATGRNLLVLCRGRSNRLATDRGTGTGPVWVPRRVCLLPPGIRRQGGLAFPRGPLRPANRALRSTRVRLAGSWQCSDTGRQGVFLSRTIHLSRRRNRSLCTASLHRRDPSQRPCGGAARKRTVPRRFVFCLRCQFRRAGKRGRLRLHETEEVHAGSSRNRHRQT